MPISYPDKWVLYRHTNNLDVIKAVAVNLNNFSKSGISNLEKTTLNNRLKALGYYSERNPELPLDAINHKINTLAYFMFGHKSVIHGSKKFLFSPLGDLMLQHFDDQFKSTRIFLAQLFAVQFPHPHSGTDPQFNLYPYRLLFKLLLDKRLEFKLYSIEIATCLMFVKNINRHSYESLVKEILDLRNKTNSQWIEFLESKYDYHVNAFYEWDYYQSKLFEEAGIIKRFEGDVILKMKQGKSTTRTIRKTYIKLDDDVVDFCKTLLSNYSTFKKPLNLNDPLRLSSDVVKEIYSFFPSELLSEIGVSNNKVLENVMNLMHAIDYHSENPEKDSPYKFEKLLADGFNYFVNVKAVLVGGAGKTDIECIYLDTKFKFCVDAKSSSNKLSSLNSGRLKSHRKKIGAGYTLIITPSYVPSVLTDIEDQDITLLLASTFTEYLYQLFTSKGQETDYSDLHKIILNNPGADISSLVSDLTFEKFAS
jgi:type II restriction enzyme